MDYCFLRDSDTRQANNEAEKDNKDESKDIEEEDAQNHGDNIAICPPWKGRS